MSRSTLDGGLRLVDLQVGVHEEEHAARPGLVQHRLGHVVEALEGLGGLDHELHRQARARPAAAGTGRPPRCAPAMLFHFCLQLLLQSRCGAALALVPGLEQHAAEALVHGRDAGDLEHLVVFGKRVRDVEDLLRVGAASAAAWRSAGRWTCDSTKPWSSCGRELRLATVMNSRPCRRAAAAPMTTITTPGVEQAVQQALVAVVHRSNRRSMKCTKRPLSCSGAEEARAHHRRQRERDDAGDGHRAGQREREFREQRAGEAALEADRHVHRDQHHGHGDDRGRRVRAPPSAPPPAAACPPSCGGRRSPPR